MKGKMITAVVAAAVIVGFSAMNASAWGWGHRGPMMGYGMMYGGNYNANVSQQSLDEIRDIRMNLAADQAELNALMSSANPDSSRVRALSEQIAAGQLALESKYGAVGYGNGYNMMGPGMMGPGMMYNGYGCW